MLKKILYILLGILICLVILGAVFVYSIFHSDKTDPVEKDIDTIKNVVNMFEDELVDLGADKEVIDEAITKLEEFNKETKYVITFDIQNDSNSILSTKINLPVEEEFFNSVEIGDVVAEEELQKIEEFAQFSQSLGSWTIVVENKIIRE